MVSVEWNETSGGVWERWHEPGVPLPFQVESHIIPLLYELFHSMKKRWKKMVYEVSIFLISKHKG